MHNQLPGAAGKGEDSCDVSSPDVSLAADLLEVTDL